MCALARKGHCSLASESCTVLGMSRKINESLRLQAQEASETAVARNVVCLNLVMC